MFVANCTNNYLEPECARWHQLHPDIGLTQNETESSWSALGATVKPKTSTATPAITTNSAM